jgi:hypothetical protein
VLLSSFKTKCSLYQAIVHDISKFYPSEWFPYANTFYNVDGSSRYKETLDFNYAWNAHQKRNPHHWQYWILNMDRGETIILEMPVKYVKEMIADWMGAGRAITGQWGNYKGLEVYKWYNENKEKIKLHDSTKNLVEFYIENLNGKWKRKELW